MHSELCNLSHRDVRHSLTHKGGAEGSGEGGRWWGVGGGGGGFLIEFPDNAEINLTPVKFDYISGAVLSCSPTVTPLFLSFLCPPPPSFPLPLFVSAVPSKHY